jgi:hypothetical protein
MSCIILRLENNTSNIFQKLNIHKKTKINEPVEQDESEERGDAEERGDTEEQDDTEERDDTEEQDDTEERDDTEEQDDTEERGDTEEQDDTEKQDNDDESIDINDIDNIYDKYKKPDIEKVNKGQCEEINDIEQCPVYDQKEPYFKFKRRWDAYMVHKKYGLIHKTMLEFLNKLFNTEYTGLISMKKININLIPTAKQFSKLFESDEKYKIFKIKHNRNVPVDKIIDTLLSKINYSFVKNQEQKNIYYTIKTFRPNTREY